MTVQEIIDRALRMIRAKPAGRALLAAERDDGLVAYNAMLLGLFGHQVGGPVRPATLRDGVAEDGGVYAPQAMRTPASPVNGARFAVTGACTVTASTGSTIEGAASVAATGPRSWFYRADTGNWVREAAQALTDQCLFPDDFHDGVAAMLALHVADEYDAQPSDTTVGHARQTARRLRASFRARRPVRADEAVNQLSRQTLDRDWWVTG